jgi:hypothetical protein
MLERGADIRYIQQMLGHGKPGLEAAFRGERIDTFAKESAALDPRLEATQITGRFQRGADFIDPVTGNWWDVTTPGSWAAHVLKYGPGGTMLPY